MYKLTDNVIEQYRLQLNEYFGGEDVYVELQELPPKVYFRLTAELQKAQKAGEDIDTSKVLSLVDEVLELILVDHNFYHDEKKKVDNKDVTNILKSKGKLMLTMSMDYINRLFTKPAETKTVN